MSISIGAWCLLTALAHSTTEEKSLCSQAKGIAFPLSPSTAAQALFAFSKVRATAYTHAPRSVSTRSVSKPIPALQPVIRAVLPDKSSPAVTSSAEELLPKGVECCGDPDCHVWALALERFFCFGFCV